MIICYTVPEIWCMTAYVTVIFHFGIFFVPPHPPNSMKNENFTKMKKRHGDIIILHKYTKSHDHMVHCSWDMACDRCNFYFSFCFGLFFAVLPPPPLTCSKNENSKKMKRKSSWRYHHFTPVYKNYDWMMHGSWDMVCNRQTDEWQKWHTDVCAPLKLFVSATIILLKSCLKMNLKISDKLR